MRIGFDVDGVLANFNVAYIDLVIEVTGRNLFPPPGFEITTWNYPESYGYTTEEVSKVWAEIKRSYTFWQNLPPYAETERALRLIAHLGDVGHDIYFVTARPGFQAKSQTQIWLDDHTPYRINPTVLIASDKAAVARALNLDYYVDDRLENAEAVARDSNTKSFLLNRSWNTAHYSCAIRIDSILDFFSHLDAASTRNP